MLTREQFVSGVFFSAVENTEGKHSFAYPYQYVSLAKNKYPGRVYELGTVNCIVTRITASYFNCTAFICGRQVNTRIYFKDLHPAPAMPTLF